MTMTASQKLFERAQHLIPGGVNSPVRAFKAVGGAPIFINKGQGPHIYDADGQRYIDYVGSWGPLILGHAAAPVVEAIFSAAQNGTSFGWATERELELAELVTRAVPSIEMIRFVNSGTEATMSALRVARAFTKKDGLIKFSGCYHGHADAFLSDAGSGVATFGIPECAGVAAGAAKDTFTVPYNDLAAVETVLKQQAIAAVIVEPVACNMGLVQPSPDFLRGLRQLCDHYSALLIFDEVITGFRLGQGGAQGHFGIRPDLSTFGKIIGGGLPVGAYGGRRDIMQLIAPVGKVYQAGTLSGNPLAMAAGIATLRTLAQPQFYEKLETRGAQLESGMRSVLTKHGSPARVDRIGSIFYLWFKKGALVAPQNYAEIKTADSTLFAKCFHSLLKQGVALAPSAFEVGFISAAHTSEHIEQTVNALDKALVDVTKN